MDFDNDVWAISFYCCSYCSSYYIYILASNNSIYAFDRNLLESLLLLLFERWSESNAFYFVTMSCNVRDQYLQYNSESFPQ